MMDEPIATQTREGGLDHLMKAVQALDDDFGRLDQTISGLMETLRVSSPAEPSLTKGDDPRAQPPTRTIIENITRDILRLQSRSEHQRGLIEWVRESIQ